jgi:hypothetical protein
MRQAQPYLESNGYRSFSELVLIATHEKIDDLAQEAQAAKRAAEIIRGTPSTSQA